MSSVPSVAFPGQDSHAVLGHSVLVKGEIHSREPLTIEGEVDGTIEIIEHRLTITGNGKVNASVKAREIELLGSMQGQADAKDKIHIRKGARFVGDIRSAALVIEDGGFIKGNIDLSQGSARK
jgi:cytoskeletal protein CcmA (bactofilin family)